MDIFMILKLLGGLGVTAVIQSSSATTVMVVSLVNSGVMSLRQAVGVIMGANIGTCSTALLSSVGASKNARRASMIIYPFSKHLVRLAEYTVPDDRVSTGYSSLHKI